MTTERRFGCPHCGTSLAGGSPECVSCGLRLQGFEAGRLWQVDQQLATLRHERQSLITTLLAPPDEADAATQTGQAAPFPSLPQMPPPAPRRSLSGQQVLLGLGALLLLSAASFFLLVVWLVVGLVGQIAIMLLLTTVAALAVRPATTRRLPAAAETAAVLAIGLLLIDLWAAHSLGLAGLDGLSTSWYWAVASPLAAVLLIGADRLVPRRRDAASLRRVVSYPPAAATFAAFTPWFVLAGLSWSDVALVGGLGLAALVEAPLAILCWRWSGGQQSRDRSRRAVAAPVIVACLTLLAFLIGVLITGFDPDRDLTGRWQVAAMLLAFGVLLGVVAAVTRQDLPAAVQRRAQFGCAAATGTTAAIIVMDAMVGVLIGICLVVAVVVALTRGRRRAAAAACLPLGYVAVVLLRITDTTSLHNLTRGLPAGDVIAVHGPDVVLMMVPALAWLGAAGWCLARARSLSWMLVVQLAGFVAAVTSVLAAPASAWTLLMGALFGIEILVAAVAVQRAHQQPDKAGWWAEVDILALITAAGYGVVAVAATFDSSPMWTAATTVYLGVVVLGYAALPGRLPFAYLGSALVSAGIDVWLSSSDVGAVEAYTGPLAVLLALVGVVQYRRDRTLPTRLVAGPALAVALLPSTLVAVSGGDEIRLGLVTAAAIILLVLGLVRSWQAPVSIGTLALVIIAITQGGPLIGYVPGWVTLGIGGAVLLAIGVAWERAVVAGRRATAWYTALR